MTGGKDYAGMFEKAIRGWARLNPGKLIFAFEVLRKFNEADAIRHRIMLEENAAIPPVLIYSITGNCNLNCAGCYSRDWQEKSELTKEQAESIFSQAEELGIFFYFIAGGEPLLQPHIMDSITKRGKGVFLLFTNATLVDGNIIKILKKNRNVVPVLSFEGGREHTDSIRGTGVYEKVVRVAEALRKKGIMTGFSVTLDGENAAYVSGEEFMSFAAQRFNFGIFVGYQPLAGNGRGSVAVSGEDYEKMAGKIEKLSEKHGLPVLNFPGDEDFSEGCMSSGRGFVHISPSGEVEPCPFVNISAGNLGKERLLQILKSDFLKNIRNGGAFFKNIRSGSCLLADNVEIVKGMRKQEP